jgi:hypothetical protein
MAAISRDFKLVTRNSHCLYKGEADLFNDDLNNDNANSIEKAGVLNWEDSLLSL